MLRVEIRKFRWDLWPVKTQVDARKVTWRGYVASNGDFTRSVTSPTTGRHTLPLAAAAEDSEPSDLPGPYSVYLQKLCRDIAKMG